MRQQPRQAPRRRGVPGAGSTPEIISPTPAVGFDDEMLDLINEYFYGIRIFPGQDPGMVYVGWVTTQYHLHTMDKSWRSTPLAPTDKCGSSAGTSSTHNGHGQDTNQAGFTKLQEDIHRIGNLYPLSGGSHFRANRTKNMKPLQTILNPSWCPPGASMLPMAFHAPHQCHGHA